jgi:hypothetical protein
MNRSQLEHALRAAADASGVRDLIVIGSQAVLGSYPDWELPVEATRSAEVDVAVDLLIARIEGGDLDDTDLADRIDGPLGEGSPFHQTNGYYVHGVERSQPQRSHRDGATASSRSSWKRSMTRSSVGASR